MATRMSAKRLSDPRPADFIFSEAADIISQHPVALQLRNLQVLSEIAVEKNSTIIFPNQFFSTIQDIKSYLENSMKP